MNVEYQPNNASVRAKATTTDGTTVEGEVVGVWRINGDIQRVEIDSDEREVPLNIGRERAEVIR